MIQNMCLSDEVCVFIPRLCSYQLERITPPELKLIVLFKNYGTYGSYGSVVESCSARMQNTGDLNALP